MAFFSILLILMLISGSLFTTPKLALIISFRPSSQAGEHGGPITPSEVRETKIGHRVRLEKGERKKRGVKKDVIDFNVNWSEDVIARRLFRVKFWIVNRYWRSSTLQLLRHGALVLIITALSFWLGRMDQLCLFIDLPHGLHVCVVMFNDLLEKHSCLD